MFEFNETNKNRVKAYIDDKLKPKVPNSDYVKLSNLKEFEKLIKYSDDKLFEVCERLSIAKLTMGDANLTYELNGSDKDLSETIGNYNILYEHYLSGYKSPETENIDINLTKILNQINRIKDCRIGATKMVLMHVVTGQDYKHTMVEETIELTNTLFKSTEIDLKTSSPSISSVVSVKSSSSASSTNPNSLSGGSKTIKSTKLTKINLSNIEIY